MRAKKFLSIALPVVIAFLGFTVFANGNDDDADYQYSGEYGAFEEISDYVAKMYIDDSLTKEQVMVNGTAEIISDMLDNNEELLVKILKNALSSLDDYSEFYTAEEYKAFEEQLNHTFYGIGITMRENEDGSVSIVGFSEDSDNAQKAGFKIGDVFKKVNGEDVSNIGLPAVRQLVIGEEGTEVNITVLRDGKEINLTAKRVAVNSPTVIYEVLDGNIGYINISSFGSDTAAEFDKALEAMRAKNVKKIILDLRNNGGGLVPVAVSIAEKIVPAGKIIDVRYRQSQYNTTYNSKLSKNEFSFITLVNGKTASASEILSSALQDSGASKLYGTQTYGKAVIQNTFPLKNNAVFKLTVGQYITRNGKEINKAGLKPDKVIENDSQPLDMSGFTSFDFTTRSSIGDKNDNIKAAKERMAKLGYYRGDTESDIFDTGFKAALKSFQITNKLFAYGVLDIPTQELLEKGVSEMRIETDTQLETAYKDFGGDVSKLYKNQ